VNAGHRAGRIGSTGSADYFCVEAVFALSRIFCSEKIFCKKSGNL